MNKKQSLDANLKHFLQKPYFYTLQEHLPTQKKQIQMWSNALITYFVNKHVSEFSRSQLESDQFFLFNNTVVRRRLNKEFIMHILMNLESLGKIKFKDSNKNLFFVYRTSIDDLAEAIYRWARNQALLGKVETIQYLCQNEDAQNEKFWGYPEETIIEACKILQNKGKVDMFDLGEDGNPSMIGIKFK